MIPFLSQVFDIGCPDMVPDSLDIIVADGRYVKEYDRFVVNLKKPLRDMVQSSI